ncbi:CHAT domain-containing protein [Hyalangium rubrum]|uniref:CHAT domain-containing protein n=1 Tax=Hyalangium rubrum TaxID=3103134 RepID=A0ABU5HET6_9BACT|nr:CHAT domain-containing protein [Hyalangium sp. s54d21]MDY7231780.1 CHAT domain-containing protein [Hyalangium sp. s54d21]
MRRALGWMMVAALCSTANVAAGKELTKATQAQTLREQAWTLVAQRRLEEAVPLFLRAFTLSEESLREEVLDLSEDRLMRLLQALRPEEERLYALLRAHPNDARLQHLALTVVLLRKGRAIEELSHTSRSVHLGAEAGDRESFDQLRALRTQLARLKLRNIGQRPTAEYRGRLTARIDDLEAMLARRSAPLRARTALPAPAEMVDRVAASLPRDAALIEFVAYEDRPLIPGASGSGQPRYLALLLFPNGRIHTVDLGPSAPIDAAITDLTSAISDRDVAYQAPARTLYSRVFQPLRPLLGNIHHVNIAPDGQLWRIPFYALHDGHKELIESFDFSNRTSGRDLLPRVQPVAPSRAVVALADPKVERPWAPLPGSRAEALAIQRLLPQTQLFLDRNATLERLHQLSAPGILHIATHGFFRESAAPSQGSRAVGQVGFFSGGIEAQLPSHPQLRSGLLFSNPDGAGSDMVSALELASLNLWGTELVVLSACETALGAVELGQGAYGLSRAFLTAGAETVVSSLWQINDDTTSVLMKFYYRNLLEGRGRGTALREAMLTLRKTHPHPQDWAPFIALGRAEPLRSIAPSPLNSHPRVELPAPVPSLHASPEWQGGLLQAQAYEPLELGRSGLSMRLHRPHVESHVPAPVRPTAELSQLSLDPQSSVRLAYGHQHRRRGRLRVEEAPPWVHGERTA